MKPSLLTITILFWGHILLGQSGKTQIITTDIAHYWDAYDQIIASTDSLERLRRVQTLYIDKGTEGLKGLMSVRHYQAQEFVDNMVHYPQYWNSIRARSADVSQEVTQIEAYLAKLKAIYPALKPADIYFAFGAFRSAGTYQGNKVLLGAEYLLAQKSTKTAELPESVQNVIHEYAPYDIPLTTIHEYIHTQQKSWENKSILHLCVAEGVAEFISTLVTQKPLSPPVKFGKENQQRVVETFMYEIVRDNDVWNWLWNKNQNALKVNDLGYYIGYEICERYYNQAKDKQQAIKDLIELDYSDEAAFAKLVDASHFLPMKWKAIGKKYESMRPKVSQIVEFTNGSRNVSSQLKVITITFSEPMDNCCRSIDFDDTKGVERLMITKHIGWSNDKRRYAFEVADLQPNTTYGLIISNFAKAEGGNRLAPYTIRFTTRKQ